MRTAIISSIAAAGLASAAQAAPIGEVSRINITISPELAANTKVLDQREFDYLARDLRHSVESRLARVGALDTQGGTLDLVIEDAVPNKPTMKQLTRNVGLSYSHSFGIGGAKVSGVYTAPDGAKTPVSYSWYEHDIRQAKYASQWQDAGRTFDLFAHSLTR